MAKSVECDRWGGGNTKEIGTLTGTPVTSGTYYSEARLILDVSDYNTISFDGITKKSGNPSLQYACITNTTALNNTGAYKNWNNWSGADSFDISSYSEIALILFYTTYSTSDVISWDNIILSK